MHESSKQLELTQQGKIFSRQYFCACLRRISQNRYLNILAGLILIAFSIDEVLESIADGFQATDLNSSMGIVMIGFLHILKSLPDLIEGIEYLEADV